MRITSQSDIDARQAKDDITYAKRTARALRIVNAATQSWAFYYCNSRNPAEIDAAKNYSNPWYRDTLRAQATRMEIR